MRHLIRRFWWVPVLSVLLAACGPFAGAPKCVARADDPGGYLLKICNYVVDNKLDISPGTPETLAIREIGKATYQGGEVIVIYLACCYMGDRAFIDPQSGAVVGYSLGAK
ncbi:MAG: hypothetical protein HZB53_15655 [Chloroflexi bacterium]|nr:hypothetical protein [Chloroflexota bacterium]